MNLGQLKIDAIKSSIEICSMLSRAAIQSLKKESVVKLLGLSHPTLKEPPQVSIVEFRGLFEHQHFVSKAKRNRKHLKNWKLIKAKKK